MSTGLPVVTLLQTSWDRPILTIWPTHSDWYVTRDTCSIPMNIHWLTTCPFLPIEDLSMPLVSHGVDYGVYFCTELKLKTWVLRFSHDTNTFWPVPMATKLTYVYLTLLTYVKKVILACQLYELLYMQLLLRTSIHSYETHTYTHMIMLMYLLLCYGA